MSAGASTQATNLADLLQGYGIRSDLWQRALESFTRHKNDPKIRSTSVITLIDFRINIAEDRLWVLDLRSYEILIVGPVAHGKLSGARTSPGLHFSNTKGSEQSSVGPFVTLGEYRSNIGGLSNAPALRIEGLDPTNSSAKNRGIVFHGGTYMQGGRTGRSRGCFVTSPELNIKIIPLIKNGTFIYAYGGDEAFISC